MFSVMGVLEVKFIIINNFTFRDQKKHLWSEFDSEKATLCPNGLKSTVRTI